MEKQKQYLTIYNYDCDLEFHKSDGTTFPIQKEGLKYLYVIHNYTEAIMPIMYININLFTDVYNEMVPDQGKGKLYLRLTNFKKSETTSQVSKTVIEEEFDYFMTDDPNTYKKLEDMAPAEKVIYRQCFIGLLKLSLQRKNRRVFEGIFKNTNSMSLVQSATSSLKMVIQPFDNNKNFKYFLCPTITSIGKFIAYLNSKASFYKGAYMYYMDFDKTYLRSNDGSFIDTKDDEFQTVSFVIQDLLEDRAITSGMIEDLRNKSYIIYLTGVEAQINVDRVSTNLIGLTSGVNTSTGAANNAMINTESTTNVSTKDNLLMTVSIDENAASNMANRIEEKSIALRITKFDLDSSVFTPNKQFLLSNYDINPKYCGKYYITNREEIYLRTGDQLICQMMLTFKKCVEN